MTEFFNTISLTTHSSLTITEEMIFSYNGILLDISLKLDSNHVSKLRHYCNGLIPIHLTDTMDILRSLEYKRKISWEDISLVKNAMHGIGRVDIAKELTEFEIKRDLTLLLDFYRRKILELDLHCCSVSVKIVAGHLVRLKEIVRDRADITAISFIIVESTRDIRKTLIEFEEDIDCSELPFSWNDFTKLVIIAGDIIAAASLNEQRRDLMIGLCSTAADELCSRMTKLGSWDDFCTHVKERYNKNYPRQNMESNPRLSMQKQRAEVIKQYDGIFEEATDK